MWMAPSLKSLATYEHKTGISINSHPSRIMNKTPPRKSVITPLFWLVLWIDRFLQICLGMRKECSCFRLCQGIMWTAHSLLERFITLKNRFRKEYGMRLVPFTTVPPGCHLKYFKERVWPRTLLWLEGSPIPSQKMKLGLGNNAKIFFIYLFIYFAKLVHCFAAFAIFATMLPMKDFELAALQH